MGCLPLTKSIKILKKVGVIQKQDVMPAVYSGKTQLPAKVDLRCPVQIPGPTRLPAPSDPEAPSRAREMLHPTWIRRSL